MSYPDASLRIETASAIPRAELCAAMQEAFSDYAIPLTLTRPAFELMMQQRGLHPGLSRVAVAEGQIVAIWLVSLRDGRGYLISSGTIPAFRKRGISRALAADCLNGLRQASVSSFQSEVLRANTAAAGLYASLGMHQNRLLDCYQIPAGTRPDLYPGTVDRMPWPDFAPADTLPRDWAPT